MSSHTICCSCGNVMTLANAFPGANVICPVCQQLWTIPAVAIPVASPVQPPPPPPPPVPAAVPVKPASPSITKRPFLHRRRTSSTGALFAVCLAVTAAVAAVFVLSKGGAELTPSKADPTPPPIAKAPSPPPPRPEPDPVERPARPEPDPKNGYSDAAPDAPLPPRKVMTNRDRQGELDLLIYRINTLGLVARVLEARGKTPEAEKLAEAMGGFLTDLDKFLRQVRAEGHEPFVPDHLRPRDAITHFNKSDFRSMDAAGREKVLIQFLGRLTAGSRARIGVSRGDDFADLDIIYHQRPKELYTIMQEAAIVPGQGGDGEARDPERPVADPAEPPAQRIPEALKILTDALRRLPAADREKAAGLLKGSWTGTRAPSVLYVAWSYLAVTDEAAGIDAAGSEAIQGYFNAVKMAEIDSFDRPRHVAALEDLRTRAPAAKAKCPAAGDLLLRFAAAHAADSGAPEAEVQKAAEGLGLRRTADGKRWGDPLAVLKANLVTEIRSGHPKDAWKRFDESLRHHESAGVRLLGAWLLAMETFDRNQGGYDRLAAGLRYIGKEQGADFAAHVEALAAGVEKVAKCGTCRGGQIPCPKCKGDGKAEVKCGKCEGKGRITKGGGEVMCRDCVGRGVFRGVDCSCPRSAGKVECTDCKGKIWWNHPGDAELSKVASFDPCKRCEGLGLPPVGLAHPCPACSGLGKTFVPTADPKRTLK